MPKMTVKMCRRVVVGWFRSITVTRSFHIFGGRIYPTLQISDWPHRKRVWYLARYAAWIQPTNR